MIDNSGLRGREGQGVTGIDKVGIVEEEEDGWQ
jgi:hypothetical protein